MCKNYCCSISWLLVENCFIINIIFTVNNPFIALVVIVGLAFIDTFNSYILAVIVVGYKKP